MEAIQTETLKRVENLLRGIGAEYAIRLGEETRGTLQVIEPKTGIRRPKLFHFEKDLGYTDTLKSIPPAGMHSWTIERDEDYVTRFRDTLRTWCNREWGRDSFVVAYQPVKGGFMVSVLRG